MQNLHISNSVSVDHFNLNKNPAHVWEKRYFHNHYDLKYTSYIRLPLATF